MFLQTFTREAHVKYLCGHKMDERAWEEGTAEINRDISSNDPIPAIDNFIWYLIYLGFCGSDTYQFIITSRRVFRNSLQINFRKCM